MRDDFRFKTIVVMAALVAAIHIPVARGWLWMAGTSPAMTVIEM
jgi:hypothetical protein